MKNLRMGQTRFMDGGEGRKTKKGKTRNTKIKNEKLLYFIFISKENSAKHTNALFFFLNSTIATLYNTLLDVESVARKTFPVRPWMPDAIGDPQVAFGIFKKSPNILFAHPWDFSPLFLDYPRVQYLDRRESAKIHGPGGYYPRVACNNATNPNQQRAQVNFDKIVLLSSNLYQLFGLQPTPYDSFSRRCLHT